MPASFRRRVKLLLAYLLALEKAAESMATFASDTKTQVVELDRVSTQLSWILSKKLDSDLYLAVEKLSETINEDVPFGDIIGLAFRKILTEFSTPSVH